MEPYLLLDALLQRDFGSVTVFAKAENLLDAQYERFGVLAFNLLGGEKAARVEPFLTPGMPRQLTVGLRLRLSGVRN